MKKQHILALFLAAALLSGCGGPGGEPEETPEAGVIVVGGGTSGEENAPAEEPAAEPEFDFAQLEGWDFIFSSGAGGWFTELHIHAGGSFDGRFQDSEMGDITEEHPSGVLITSDFEGHFTQPEQVNDYTFSFRIADISYPQGDRQEIIAGTLYEYTPSAYGLDGAEELLLYLPGAPVAELPEMYLNWVRSAYGLYEEEITELPGYGLYNVQEENGFSSYREDAIEPAPTEAAFDPALALELVIDEAAAEAVPFEEQLAQAATQADMNEAGQALYQVWDGALNRFWQTLKEHLPREEMETLTREQLDWIREKEAAVQAETGALEGGSLAGLAGSTVATEYTKDRLNELLDYFQSR